MEHQKIRNLLDKISDNLTRLITKKWIEVHDQSGSAEDRYKPTKQLRFKTSMLRSDLWDFSDAYIFVKGTITLKKTNEREIIDIRNRFSAFKNDEPFTNCISRVNNVLTDNVDLDVVMPRYNLLEYSKNYRKTTGSLWNYYRDQPNDFSGNNYDANPITNSEPFKYKSSITANTSNANQEDGENTEQGNTKARKNLEIVFP